MSSFFEHTEGLSYELKIGDKKHVRRFGTSDQFAPELLYLSDCILGGKDPEPSGREGMIDVQVIEALQQSIKTGRWHTLELARTRRPTRAQVIRRPALRKPELVHVESLHS